VTDGAKGIGAAIVRACAAESAKVVIVDRDAEHGEKLQAEFSSGGNCSFVLADLGAEESCSQAVEQAVGNFGELDALVNNAGVNEQSWPRARQPQRLPWIASAQSGALLQYGPFMPCRI